MRRSRLVTPTRWATHTLESKHVAEVLPQEF